MIRAATEADIPRLVEMGRRFRQESTYAQYLADNPEKMEELGKTLLAANGLLLAEQDDGITAMLGFIVHNHFISGEKVAGEVFWWAEPERRGDGVRLLRETENRARGVGAKYMQMIAPNARVAAFYERIGYEFVESTHQKAL